MSLFCMKKKNKPIENGTIVDSLITETDQLEDGSSLPGRRTSKRDDLTTSEYPPTPSERLLRKALQRICLQDSDIKSG